MKTIQATDAKNRFCELLDDAALGPVRIQKDGRDVAVVMSSADYDQHIQSVAKKDLVQRYHEESIERFGPLCEALAK